MSLLYVVAGLLLLWLLTRPAPESKFGSPGAEGAKGGGKDDFRGRRGGRGWGGRGWGGRGRYGYGVPWFGGYGGYGGLGLGWAAPPWTRWVDPIGCNGCQLCDELDPYGATPACRRCDAFCRA